MRPRIVIAALKGGSGKTLVSLGLVSAWRGAGVEVAPFKKGPDFIDAGWLTFAAGRPCYNLDPVLMNEAQVLASFLTHSEKAGISVVEGNRGLYDGLNLDGCCSTAELARQLRAPVLVVLDVSMATRTMAAIIKGCQVFDPGLDIAGVILNRVAGPRQEGLIADAISQYCDLPVLGAIPRLKQDLFPERHMGLVPFQERDHAVKAVSWARETVEQHLALDEIRRIARGAPDLAGSGREESPVTPDNSGDAPRIGFIRDRSFWFYYPENLAYLEGLGAELVEINAISDPGLPAIDALYIGGGFPETQASALSENRSFREDLRRKIEDGLPVYAECGGLMYLGEALLLEEKNYPMVGAIPVRFALQKRPRGHGYTVLEVDRPNPYFPEGETIRGHEFHYSRPIFSGDDPPDLVFRVRRGHGMDGKRDGICRKNLLGTYTHIHAAGNAKWAEYLFRAAVRSGGKTPGGIKKNN